MTVTKIRHMKRIIRNVFGVMAVTMLICGCENNSDLSVQKFDRQTQVKENSTQSETDTKINSQNESPQGSQNKFISEEEAKNIVFNDAGVSENQVSSQRVKLEMDDGIWEYEVGFYVGNKEYDYEVDAASGTIRKKDMDIDDDFYQPSAQENYISETDAKALALAKVSGASENNIHMHLDYDDGRAIYEGSIHYQGIEYEFEIDAVTGTFLDWDIDD